MAESESPWGQKETQFFYELTPDKILDAIESVLDVRCTGRAFAHNSMENRVYELELDLEHDPAHPYDKHKIVKFYRPGRWNREQIAEEHRFLLALREDDIPVVAPEILSDGSTLARLEGSGLFYCVFPKVGGRSPHELSGEQIDQVGRLLARLHNVGAAQNAEHRIRISAEAYGRQNLSYLMDHQHLPPHLESTYRDLVQEICDQAESKLESAEQIQIHGDCHLGNLLWGAEGPFWVDFDDSVIGPPVQDLWLMVLGRGAEYKQQMDRLIRSYEMMREFDWASLDLIEPLRALRMIHFHGWIARRAKDPAFQRAFPDFGTELYWATQIHDLQEQKSFMDQKGVW
ncbi:serine/threonine protein kinase [Pseudobacteriovorax antillogorgiicola]|uniref:Stress response kinase A n=1 Tax=Pseudobacteriovorax antillogorgiicola TaxID=1513793 RepID=A0A1Y6CFP5_9BACT|nr:serine/threonine protein kinase [Pseudobacteriovorax antillogorgiicola]TCS51790.1 homoserine kinase [Pseudobacteriovorax antillogorgiicola]SMF50007.1 Ser/Thr protein kinase RdoA involved in Cpx stress response, MazF antagonist [Pseudobacteriovorax antillogorgiicola]